MKMTEQEISRRTRRSFLTGGVLGAAGFGAWLWVRMAKHDGGVPWQLRQVHEANDVF